MSVEADIAEPDSRVQETQFSRQDAVAGQDADSNTTSTTAPQPPDHTTIRNNNARLAPPSNAKAPRVLGPDLLRGFIIILQSIDHASVSSGAWGHGQGTESEGDGQIVDTWISPVGWTARTLTHLCAPGFMFLLGMGVVYFGRSRSKLGWSNFAMVRHFFVRALVLALVSEVIGLMVDLGKIVILNTVLLALAVNYFLMGLLWLLINGTEAGLTRLLVSSKLLAKRKRNLDERRPLLADETASTDQATAMQALAAWISFHVHNLLLLALAVVTIWMNIWMSPDNGTCSVASTAFTGTVTPTMAPGMPSQSGLGVWFDFWFYPVWTPRVMSGFPPFPWISFAIIGLLYARIVLSNPSRPAHVINTGNLVVGLTLLLLFVCTRLLHFGNLSEGCLHMPEHPHSEDPSHNQYLASFRSFFYIVKYPPSPAYLFFTMGMNFIALAAFGTIPERIGKRLPGLLVFGTSALFFYTLHLMLYAGLGALAKMWFGHENPKKTDPFRGGPAVEIGEGPVFWFMWLLGLAIMYPLCRWYGAFKATKVPDSVWRFF